MKTWRCDNCNCLVIADENEFKAEQKSKYSDELTVGALTLNSNSGTTHLNGKEYHLSITKAAILNRLMINPDYVVRRETLWKLVSDVNGRNWGPEEDDVNPDRLLKVHISHIRAILGTDIIDTIWGYGYKLGDKVYKG